MKRTTSFDYGIWGLLRQPSFSKTSRSLLEKWNLTLFSLSHNSVLSSHLRIPLDPSLHLVSTIWHVPVSTVVSRQITYRVPLLYSLSSKTKYFWGQETGRDITCTYERVTESGKSRRHYLMISDPLNMSCLYIKSVMNSTFRFQFVVIDHSGRTTQECTVCPA